MEQAVGASTTNNTRSGCAKLKKRPYFIKTDEYLPESKPDNVQYLVQCEDSYKDGRWHGHAFIYFKNEVTLTAIKKLFGKSAHSKKIDKNYPEMIKYIKGLIPGKGKTMEDVRKYNIQEWGTPPMDNGKHKLEQAIEKYNTVDEIMTNDPVLYCQYRNGIRDIMNKKTSMNRYKKPPNVIWTYGPTGKGKTEEAFDAGATNVEYANGFFTDWGDSRIISIEEMNGQIPYKTMLKLLDQYHNYYQINIKGGYKLVDLDTIYITSSKHPKECYPNQDERDSISQLLRRITTIKCTKQEYEYDV